MADRIALPVSRVTAIADQARRLGGVSGELTPAQIQETLEGVTKSEQFPNGTEWTQANAINLRTEYISYAKGVLVATGSSGIYYSTDGMTWTKSNAPETTYYQPYYANGLWVVDSDGSGLYYSTDGITWTQSNIISGTLNGICNANGIWVVATSLGLYYSTDGMTWTKSDIFEYAVQHICNGNGIWIAGGKLVGLYYSSNGITWERTYLAGHSHLPDSVNCVTYANGIFIITVGWPTGKGIYYSHDGIEWTKCSLDDSFYEACYADGLWVATGGTGPYYSTDGMTWTKSNLSSSDMEIFSVLHNVNSVWFVSDVGTPIYYSTDGMTWTKSDIPSGAIYDICNSNGIWLVSVSVDSINKSGIYYSTDCKTWTKSSVPGAFTTYAASYIKYVNGVWVSSQGVYFYYSIGWAPTA